MREHLRAQRDQRHGIASVHDVASELQQHAEPAARKLIDWALARGGSGSGGGLARSASLRPLGEQHFKGIEQPEAVFQLCHPDLRLDFPPLKVLLAPADDTTPSIGATSA